ncbi:hypothetical protein J2T02_005192 [Chitinophaga terrae (ex Kim and Jung 2007)]|uniref:discoidin domain-containing protein n=1 Tax=Chitinophaga terrae (ex Kim and Jung 2007) TaxID=408074 RepID=UPI002786E127|nr:discoidin domain-containing protein [Chitinophaga terrae (ex Kim and Jung 2007)]MDQ0110044.1 hypothetical protein [Chitinophaga terrae (ex Kim and Jung 2007)]
MKLYAIIFMGAVMVFLGCEKAALQKISAGKTMTTQQAIVFESTDIPVASVSASSALWPAAALKDSNDATIWSSNTHSSAGVTEWVAYWFNGFDSVNYIKMLPRYNGAAALGFPVSFKVYTSNGSNWVLAATDTAFPAPQQGWVILPLPSAVYTNGIQVVATALGKDNVNNYVFQLAEVGAGYDARFNQFRYIGNNSVYQQNEIRNVGSGTFNPAKMSNWNYDERNPIIAAQPGGNSNVYAPSIQANGGAWNVYFGGWDGTTDGHDRISVTVTNDNFLTFNPHALMIDNGVMIHMNNETVIKTADGIWRMFYTTYGGSPALNKPGYATSANGVNWTPSSGNASYLLNMSGYANWNNADVNGSNVIYYEGGTYHLYFNDFNYPSTGHAFAVHHATSTDMINFTYTGDVLNEGLVAQDVKKFTYSGNNYYLMVLHINGNELRYSVGTGPATFPASQQLTTNLGASDRYITSAGFVTKDNRLYGVLYGAGPVSTLDHNAIHAKWLQKKVLFISDRTGAQWGDIERAYGPDRIKLYMNTNIETGHFYIYDTDGSTLLYTSPRVTMRSGDIWEYRP